MNRLSRNRFLLINGVAFLVALAALLLTPLVGSTEIDPVRALVEPSSIDGQILFHIRLPRILFAAVVGGCLAVAGIVFQAVLRNPLASPFTLGVSGGGSLGAVVAIMLGWEGAILGISFLPFASFTGALGVIFFVYFLSRTSFSFSPLTLLLSGIVLNYICASLILLLQYFSDFTKSFMMMRWMMGGLDIFEFGPLLSILPFVVGGMAILLIYCRQLNVLSAGEEWAASRGVQVNRLITMQYFGTSLVTGAVVAFSGPIGFVGLIVPHLLRLLIGADHRLLIPVGFLSGGAFLVVCDTLARTVMAPIEIPVGIFTSILGGPFFLWLLLSRKQKLFF